MHLFFPDNRVYFNENMKLLAELPKITKCLKLRSAFGGSILNWELKIGNYSIFMIFGFQTQHRSWIKKTARSDTTILGIFRFIRVRP